MYLTVHKIQVPHCTWYKSYLYHMAQTLMLCTSLQDTILRLRSQVSKWYRININILVLTKIIYSIQLFPEGQCIRHYRVYERYVVCCFFQLHPEIEIRHIPSQVWCLCLLLPVTLLSKVTHSVLLMVCQILGICHLFLVALFVWSDNPVGPWGNLLWLIPVCKCWGFLVLWSVLFPREA